MARAFSKKDAIYLKGEHEKILKGLNNVIDALKKYDADIKKANEVYGLPEELAREIQDECFFPDGLLCTLRRYQELGVKYILHQERVLLGDEMGLGKTVQAIVAMVSLKNTGATHFFVVCPASVIINWCREIVKHSKLSVVKIHGLGRNEAINAWLRTGGVAVLAFRPYNYDTISVDIRALDRECYRNSWT